MCCAELISCVRSLPHCLVLGTLHWNWDSHLDSSCPVWIFKDFMSAEWPSSSQSKSQPMASAYGCGWKSSLRATVRALCCRGFCPDLSEVSPLTGGQCRLYRFCVVTWWRRTFLANLDHSAWEDNPLGFGQISRPFFELAFPSSGFFFIPPVYPSQTSYQGLDFCLWPSSYIFPLSPSFSPFLLFSLLPSFKDSLRSDVGIWRVLTSPG